MLFERVDQIDLTEPHSGRGISHLWQDSRTRSRSEGIAADARCDPGRCAAAGCPSCAGRLWSGSLGWKTRKCWPGSDTRLRARAAFTPCARAPCFLAQPASSRDASTTHWATIHLLPLFGAIPVNERVVVDGAWVFAAGVTAGIDGALRLAAELRGSEAGEAIQLHMVFAPEPPFPCSDRYFELRQTTPTHLAAKVRGPPV